MAKLNHFNILTTILHPALWLSQFKSINDDSCEHAQDVFTYHFCEYEASTPASTLQPTPGPQPATSNSFLANIAHHSTSVLVAAPNPASEFDQFAIYEHGKDEILALEHPLLWWKAHQHEFPVIACMACNFLAIPGAMVSVE